MTVVSSAASSTDQAQWRNIEAAEQALREREAKLNAQEAQLQQALALAASNAPPAAVATSPAMDHDRLQQSMFFAARAFVLFLLGCALVCRICQVRDLRISCLVCCMFLVLCRSYQ